MTASMRCENSAGICPSLLPSATTTTGGSEPRIDARIDAPSAVERPTLASIVTAQPWPDAWLWIAGAAPTVTLSPMTNTRLGVSAPAAAG